MIKNTAISEKIKEKTASDPDIAKFITDILENEGEKTQWKKTYRNKVEKILRDRGEIK